VAPPPEVVDQEADSGDGGDQLAAVAEEAANTGVPGRCPYIVSVLI